jgi:hypothetical protein
LEAEGRVARQPQIPFDFAQGRFFSLRFAAVAQDDRVDEMNQRQEIWIETWISISSAV